MNKLVPAVLLSMLVLVGCPLDTFFGVAALPDGSVKIDPESPAHQIGKAVKDGGSGTPISLAGAGMLLIANLYQALRQKALRKAIEVTVQGVEDFSKSEEGAGVATALKTRLAHLHAHENIGPLMSGIVASVTKK